MATVYVTLQSAGIYGRGGIGVAVAAKPFRSETITSSGTTNDGALIAQKGDIATVFCTTAVYATGAAADGSVSATTGKFCPAGIPTDIAMDAGEVLHVIDA